MTGEDQLASSVRVAARALRGSARDFDSLLESSESADYVLIGEATHGTREFYALRLRALVT